MKKINIFFWITTILFCFFMVYASIPDVLSTPEAIAFMHDHLGYPVYFIPMIGVAKLLGVIAVIIPGFPRIKEWAYAGLIFDLLGAIYSIIAVGNAGAGWTFMLLPLSLGAASYFLHHKKLKLAATHAA